MIDMVLSLHWREPLWLGLALMPLLFLAWRWRRRARLLRYADAALLPWAASQPGAGASTNLRGWAHGLAWLLLALAAAGPRTPLELREGHSTPRHLLTVMVALDVSASMRATDTAPQGDFDFLRAEAREKSYAPDRLTRARLELLDWLPRLQGERVGLIVYAGEAGLLLPPTDDIALLQRAIEQADPRLIEAQGSNLAAALDLARTQLEAAPGQARAVLLVTDAESGSADAAAAHAVQALRKAGLPLFVLGVGSEAGAPVPLPEGGFAEQDGVQVQSRMAVAPYRQWAQTSGGRFAEVSDGDADWMALHDRGIASLPGDPVTADASAAWNERFGWFVAPALALFMTVSLPRRVVASVALAVAAGSTVAPSPSWADEAAAWQAWQQKRYGSAQTFFTQVGGYSGRIGAGAAAWRLADYGVAAQHFGVALLLAANDHQRANALYNLGNAHYGRGQYAIAVEAFEAVLRLRPQDQKAQTNLGWARQRLSRQPTDTPMQSDLRGRRGMLAEGQIQLDGEGWRKEDTQSDSIGVQVDRRSQTAADARASSSVGSKQTVTFNSNLAVSGLNKLDRLADRPDAMLKNLLKQDARHDSTERAPW